MGREFLSHFELLILSAVMRLSDDAYGVTIAAQIERSTGKVVIFASLYKSLDGLESKGLVMSEVGEPLAQRGGKARRYFQVTGQGVRAVKAARGGLMRLWQGVPALEGGRT
jgi:DNA-binding PadR family transcriptional regulator